MPQHVVVDGSNIATEGRSLPSLAQLNEAVMAFMAEYPEALITVVVDATFGHRIDPKETAEFDEAIANNELVAPPAGAVGRGDAFVLSIAKKVNATILTNDSYQEFHGQVDWLFDEGRLIGGKPVPHVGWVFVPRLPVRGAVSRSAVKDAKRKRGGSSKAPATVRQGSAAANQPMPVPKTPPPSAKPTVSAADVAKAEVSNAPAEVVAAASVTPKAVAVNDFLPFLAFVEHHPVGSSVNAVVENYSSHGAYVRVGDVKGYVPLRLMADPAPRSAREFMKIGDAVTLVVESFAPARRSIDLAVAGMSTAKLLEPPPVKASRSRKKAAATTATPAGHDAPVSAVDAPADTEGSTSTRPAKVGRAAKASTSASPTKATKATRTTKSTKATRATKITNASGALAAKATKSTGRGTPAKAAPASPSVEATPVADGVEQPSDAGAVAKPARRTTKKSAPADHQPKVADAPTAPAAKQPAKRAAKKTVDGGSQPAKRGAAKSAAVSTDDAAPPAGVVDGDSGAATSADAPPARRRRRVH
jgi:hypothetical protein